jgi:hypothetical protein
MQSRGLRIGLVVVAAAIAVGLFVVLSGDDDDESESTPTATTEAEAEQGEPAGGGDQPKPDRPEPEVPVVEVRGGEPVGGVQMLSFKSGDEVRFKVESDIAEHVHVHGYDVIQDIAPGKPITFAFPAEFEGVFEVELEDSHVQIAELEVSPG